MNRKKAKLLTSAGIGFVIISAILLIITLVFKLEFSPIIAVVCLIIGIILVVVSLAYYTEK